MLIKIINFIHLILVLILVCSIFIQNYEIKKYSFIFLIFIFLQYITNYGKCGLTELEYIFKKEKYQEGFIYRIIKPIITIPEKYFNHYLFILHIIWIFILWKQLKNVNLWN